MPTNKERDSKKKNARRPVQLDEDTFEGQDQDAEASEASAAEEAIDFETVKVVSEDSPNVSEELYSKPSEEDTYGHHSQDASSSSSSGEESSDRKKVHIEFPYSDVVRAKVPKAFEVAENVAEEWMNDGNFESIPVGHPLAQMTVAAGLRKAKEVEKKLEEKGVFAIAKMGLELAKSKLKK